MRVYTTIDRFVTCPVSEYDLVIYHSEDINDNHYYQYACTESDEVCDCCFRTEISDQYSTVEELMKNLPRRKTNERCS